MVINQHYVSYPLLLYANCKPTCKRLVTQTSNKKNIHIMDLLQQLQWRYATKRMNQQKVETQKLQLILDAIHLAPTSYGLQPFSVIVVENPELRKKIHEAACMQPQIIESSHILVFAVKAISTQMVDKHLENTAKTRSLPIEALDGYKKIMHDTVNSRDEQTLFNWASRQAYIGLGIGLVAAANQLVDATPIEGFVPAELDKVLDLPSLGLKSVVIMALGYRNEELDPLSKAKKVRIAPEKFFIYR